MAECDEQPDDDRPYKKEPRGHLPMDPRRNQTLEYLGLPNLSLYKAEDYVLIRQSLVNQTLPDVTMRRLQEEIAVLVGDPKTKERIKVSAFKALMATWLKIQEMKINIHKIDEPQPTAVAATQININIPSNGRIPQQPPE